MTNTSGQILSELGEIAKRTTTEATSVPGDVAAAALESLGGTSTNKTTGTVHNSSQEHSTQEPGQQSPLEAFRSSRDEVLKKRIARKALSYLAGSSVKEPEATVQERLSATAREEEENKMRQTAAVARMAPLSVPRGKRRGDLFGIKGKQSSEVSRNVRQD